MTPLFKSLTVAASLALSVSLPAFADQASEDYVRENANHALSMLNDPELDSLERREAFQGLMNQFTDLERVSRFVIGRYARVFDDQEFDAYYDAYARYALATYEAELDKYRGEEIVVTGSTDRNDRDSIVETVVRRPAGDLPVRWRVLSTDDGEYQVVDVALELDGNLLWLAIEQRAQFMALLDRSNGSSAELIRTINEMTARLEARALAQRTDAGEVTGASSVQAGR